MNFDLLVALTEGGFNAILAGFYGNPSVQSQIFSGSQTLDILGVSTTVAWSVGAAPTVTLSAPTSSQWQNAYKADGTTPQPTADCFTINLSQLTLSETVNGTKTAGGSLPLSVICTIAINGSQIAFQALAVSVDLSGASPIDQQVYKHVVIPKALQALTNLISGKSVPSLNFGGLQFQNYAVQVGGGFLLGGAMVAGNNGSVVFPDPATLPGSPFLVALSPNAAQQATNAQTQNLVGKYYGRDWSKGGSWFGISCNGGLTVNGINLALDSATQVSGAISFSPSASGSVTVFHISTDVGFNGYVTPDPVGLTLGLGFGGAQGTTLQATIESYGQFVTVLNPTGNWDGKVVAELLDPAVQAIVVFLPEILQSVIVGQSFGLLTISPSTQTVAGATFTITPQNLSLSPYEGALMVTGNVSVS